MELHQIRYFLAVVDANSFTRAAERCNVSQPALTKAIQKLEVELDGPLLHRDRAGPKLTTLGELLLPRLRRMEALSASVQTLAEHHRLLKSVPLRVGVLKTIGPSWLAERLEDYRQRAPGVELELRVLDLAGLHAGLEEASIDLGITNADVADKDWMVVRPLYEERYVVALPPEHALAGQQRIALRELVGQRYIDRLACELRERVAATCATMGIELYATHRSADENWIECMVRAGVGVALLPEHSIVSNDTVRRELIEPAVTRRIAVVRNVDHPASPAAQLMWEMLGERED